MQQRNRSFIASGRIRDGAQIWSVFSSFHSPPAAWRGPANPRPHRGAGSGLGSSAGTAFPPAPGLQRESLPVEQEGVRIIFLFWKLKSAPGVGDREGEIPECTLQPRRQGCPPAREEAAASYSTTTGTART